MSKWDDLIDSYMHYRQARGLQPSPKTARLLTQFTNFLAHGPDRDPLFTTGEAVQWATAPTGAQPVWHSLRLSVVRQFVFYLAGLELPVEVPPTRQLPAGSKRAVPFIYTDEEISRLMDAATRLRSTLRAATMATITGLLTVTGMRIGEVLNLNIGDIDNEEGTIVIRTAKFNRQRIICIDPTTTAALSEYVRLPDRGQFSTSSDQSLFKTTRGTRPGHRTINDAWQRMCTSAGITQRAGARPRIHDLRHTYTTKTMIDAYKYGSDPAATLSALAIWLGHSSPAYTYWYLQAVPELAAITANLLETGEQS